MNDTDYMSIALKLAEKGCGKVSPNPMVGAVIVKAATSVLAVPMQSEMPWHP